MDDVYLGEIRYVGFNYAPQGWAICAGQSLSITQNTALFSLLGTTYGGDGRTTFNLPDLRGRVSLGQGQGPGLSQYNLGQSGGTETVTLTTDQLPAHNHNVAASSNSGTSGSPTTGVFATPAVPRGGVLYSNASPSVSLAATEIGTTGSAAPHSNLAPGMSMTAIIAIQGIFPQRP